MCFSHSHPHGGSTEACVEPIVKARKSLLRDSSNKMRETWPRIWKFYMARHRSRSGIAGHLELYEGIETASALLRELM